MQVAYRWTPPVGTLGQLVAEAEARVALLAPRRMDLEAAARLAAAPPDLVRVLRRDHVAVIAEVKRKSPSRGDINLGLRAADLAAEYAEGGAAAISVLTEPRWFGGHADDLSAVRARVTLPLLRKDFLIDPIQLVEARALGAAAVLLIVRALDQVRLIEMMGAARSLGLEPLVEIHGDGELERALAAGAWLIGVNNRDLESLKVDSTIAPRLIQQVPQGVITVAESGIATRADVERAAQAGADAVLVGSALSGASDPVAAVRGLRDVPRQSRTRG